MNPRRNWSLATLPDDQAVANLGGRTGAKDGPKAFREFFFKLKGTAPVFESLQDGGDWGGFEPKDETRHEKAAVWLSQVTQAKTPTVIVGGSHDHGYTQLMSVKKLHPKARIGCINVDAHFDLRPPNPLILSGSPFWLAIEKGLLKPQHLIEFGIQRHCNAPELWAYAKQKKIPVVHFEGLRFGKSIPAFKAAMTKLAKQVDQIVLSFDIDAVAQAFAPGVSAPQAEGFTPSEALEMMRTAARHPKVQNVGLFELNPKYDLDGRTARLAATLAYHFVSEKLRI